MYMSATAFGAMNRGRGSALASGEGSENAGYHSVGLWTASGHGSANRGYTREGGDWIASGHGSLNLGAGSMITNTGHGSIALSGLDEKIELTNNTSIILGSGVSQEDRSILADVYRARNTVITTNLQITGGGPTNGAVFMATNSLGQGAWKLPSYFFVVKTNSQSFSTALSNVTFDVENFDNKNRFADNAWTPGSIGYVFLRASIRFNDAQTGQRYIIFIVRDGISLSAGDLSAASSVVVPQVSTHDYCPSSTSKYWVAIQCIVGGTNTAAASIYNNFSGHQLP